MIPWKLKLLGDCALACAESGEDVRLSTRKSLALLAFLALQPGRRARRARLSALLWEETDAEQGRLHVRKALWLLRSESAKAAGANVPPPIAAEGEWLAIPQGLVATDVDALLEASAAAGEDPAKLEAAAALYTGDFLGGFAIRNAPAFEEWAEVERQRIREAAVSLLRRLVDALAAQPESNEAAMRAALRLLAVDPLQEHAHRAVMRLHVRQGRAAAALAQYHQLRETLRRELGVDPEPQTQALFQEIGTTRRAGPAKRSPERPAGTPSEEAGPDPVPAAAEPPPVSAPATPGSSRLHPKRWLAAVGIAALCVAGFALGTVADTQAAAPQVDRIFPIASDLVVSGRPALSPDGSRVAFTARAPESTNVDLYLYTIGDDRPVRLTRDEGVDDNAAWSPDGTRIAFTRGDPDGGGPCRIFAMTAPGGSEQPLGGCRSASSTRLAWTQDGAHLVYSDRAEEGAPLALHRLALADGRTERLTEPPGDLGGDVEPALSSDGRTIAFLRSSSRESAEIFLLDLATRETTRLTADSNSIWGLAWSEGDGGLFFSSSRGGDAGLWWVKRGGGAPERVSEGLLRYQRLARGLGGRRIVFEAVRDRSGFVELGAAGQATPETSDFREWSPDVAGDGSLVYVSTRAGGEQIWVRRGSEAPRQVTRLSGWRVLQPRWSPDGRHIAFIAVQEGRADLYRIAREGGQPVRLTDDGAEDFSPDWSADGRFLYFGSRREGVPAVWRVAAFEPGAEAARVTPPGHGHFRIDRAGRYIYFVHPGRPGLWRRRLAEGGGGTAGPEEKLLDSPAAVDGFNWALGTDSIFFIDRPDAVNRGSRLKRLDLASGRIEDLADASALHRGSGFALTPAGRPLLNVQSLRIELYGMDFR
jgi:Tol biopolymer transport system component/DNA-binding SARP family transcriptional activator